MSQIVISEFLVSPPICIIDDIKELYNNGTWLKALCRNKKAFPYLKQNIKKWLPIHIKWISSHCDDIPFLIKYKKYIDFSNLSRNPNINKLDENILIKNIKKLDWWFLSKNESAVCFLKKYPKKIIWQAACLNPSIEMIQWIDELYSSGNLDMSENWQFLTCNPNAINVLLKYKEFIHKKNINLNSKSISFLKDNPLFINYKVLCYNNSFEAMELLKERINIGLIDDLCFENLSTNPYAIDILKENPERIDWDMTILNENVGLLYEIFPDKISKYIKYTINYPSVLPYIKEYLHNVSPVILATNPDIFYVDKGNYKNRLKSIQQIINRIKNIK
jgi:hypothetical protein